MSLNLILNILKLARVHQWVKNLIILFPLIFAHKYPNYYDFLNFILAFISFSFCTSSVYIFNDIIDYKTDIYHPYKKKRPIASGKVSIKLAIFFAFLFLVLSFVMALFLNIKLTIVLIVYLILNFFYSNYLKKIFFLDVLVLTCFYNLRIIFGSYVFNILISKWLFFFSILFFLSLSLFKRLSELTLNLNTVNRILKKQGYPRSKLNFLKKLSFLFSNLSIAIIFLYIFSPDAQKIYTNFKSLLMANIILMFWINRFWHLCCSNNIKEDIFVFILKDKISYSCLILILYLVLYS